MPIYGSPNQMAWEYFSALNTVIQNAQQAESPESCRRMAMLAVVQSVTVGEVFMNLWFRAHVEQNPEHRSTLLEDLQSRKGLEHKLKKWPPRYLSRTLNLASGPGGKFSELRELRNSLVHFTSSFDDVSAGPVTVGGLANITEYNGLNADSAVEAGQAVEGLVEEIFRLAGIPKSQLAAVLHAWIGRMEAVTSSDTEPSIGQLTVVRQ